ncbi:hypothetical protein AM501_23900 [Aneurinibacillus migulanus]|uniref:Tad domain-containing protein n=1 Tax=Aneurinibacillus migulanus TaxID=47500 RepID=UPI0005BDA709|nr:Tad domain-containing protein [Aneurinibacillus migulanus]KIV58947.1 hypothetical protein TS64_04080 [Aneurinibacillus migulanus]KPD05821.1 hypothetical protein AM501_23900 [Aneurinibacillus migulanus]
MKKVAVLKNDKGSTLVFTLALTLVFLPISYITLLVGYVKLVEHLAYNIADASALAGASQYMYVSEEEDPWKWGETTRYKATIDEVAAEKKAKELFEDNRKTVEFFVKTVVPSYKKLSDNEYQVSVTVTYRPLYSDKDVTKTIVSQARIVV